MNMPKQIFLTRSFFDRRLSNVAMPFKKESPFLHSFNIALEKLRQTGVVEKVEFQYKRYYKQKQLINCEEGVNKMH